MMDRNETLAALDSPQEETRLEAVRALVKSGEMQAAQHLKRLAGNDPSPQVRYYAQKGLDHLSRRIVAEDPAATAGARGKNEILGKLSGILSSGNRDVKLRALQMLGLHGFREGLPMLLEHYPKEEDPFVRSKMLLS